MSLLRYFKILTGAKGSTLEGAPTSTNQGDNRQGLDIQIRKEDGTTQDDLATESTLSNIDQNLSNELPNILQSLENIEAELLVISQNQVDGDQKTEVVVDGDVVSSTNPMPITGTLTVETTGLATESNQNLIIDELISFSDFGTTNNIPQTLGSIFEIDNSEGYNSIAFHLTPPTGGVVLFEGTFDGTNWTPITIREVGTNGYTQKTAIQEDYIGSISCLRKIRIRVTTGGSAPGTIIGRIVDNVSTIEGIEHSAAPHNFGYTPVHKDFSFTTSQTNTTVWTPTIGKKFVVTDLTISSLGSIEVKIFDQTDASGNYVYRGKLINGSNVVISKKTPFISSAINNTLRITSSTNADISGVIDGYEID